MPAGRHKRGHLRLYWEVVQAFLARLKQHDLLANQLHLVKIDIALFLNIAFTCTSHIPQKEAHIRKDGHAALLCRSLLQNIREVFSVFSVVIHRRHQHGQLGISFPTSGRYALPKAFQSLDGMHVEATKHLHQGIVVVHFEQTQGSVDEPFDDLHLRCLAFCGQNQSGNPKTHRVEAVRQGCQVGSSFEAVAFLPGIPQELCAFYFCKMGKIRHGQRLGQRDGTTAQNGHLLCLALGNILIRLRILLRFERFRLFLLNLDQLQLQFVKGHGLNICTTPFVELIHIFAES
mmetsp:Transcript_19926/g.50606  ORF Transcript_19926/g.50606 Transcript_19926/m.50606 type:complete len:289 (-) Transcript_19926:397-1263(-)